MVISQFSLTPKLGSNETLRLVGTVHSSDANILHLGHVHRYQTTSVELSQTSEGPTENMTPPQPCARGQSIEWLPTSFLMPLDAARPG